MSRRSYAARVACVSDGRNVPPTPGTEPRVAESRERRYREEPGIYEEHRGLGSHAYTLDEIDARIMACAADQASVSEPGPLRPALFRELEGVFWHRLFRDLPGDRDTMAEFGTARALATVRRDAAGENRVRFERQGRELESRQLRLPRPVTGLTLSRTWFLLVCLAPAALIEIIGSTPSVQEAFKLDIGWAILFAVSISATLVLTAEQLGNALAAAVASSRRRTIAVAALLLVIAVSTGIVAIISLAHSRETNLSFREAVEASRETRDESGRIGGEVGSASTAGASEFGSAEGAPSKPDFSFFIPLSILVLTASTLVAFRVEAAREYNELTDELARARKNTQDQQDLGHEEVDSAVEATAGESEVLQGLIGRVEEERNLLAIWTARFEVEYGRFCAAAGVTPRPVTPLPLPDVVAVLWRILHPLDRHGPAADEAEAIGAIVNAPEDFGDPDDDDAAGVGGGDPGGPQPPEPPGEEIPPEWGPEPERQPGPQPRTSFDEQGRPAGGTWRDAFVSQQAQREEQR
jgi:hypothetical protein